jgi:hypothetical protein
MDKSIYEGISPISGIEINGYSNHLVLIDALFKNVKKGAIKHIFEYGCGFGSTAYFLQKSKSVIALEMQSDGWFWRVRNDLKPIYPHLEIHLALERCHWNFLGKFNQNFDLVFVDGHGDTRPECINYAMGKGVPYIVSHDTEEKGYGWERVINNQEYHKLTMRDFNNWTTLWTTDTQVFGKLKSDFNWF